MIHDYFYLERVAEQEAVVGMAGGGCEAGVAAAGLLLAPAGGRGGGRHPGPHHRVVTLLATPRQGGGQRGEAAAVRSWADRVDTSRHVTPRSHLRRGRCRC